MKKLLEAAHLIYLNQMQGTQHQSEESTEDFEEFKMLPERLPATRA
jgi:hypothetical protein